MPVVVAWIISALTILFRSRIGMFIIGALTWLGITYGAQKIVIEPIINTIYGYMDAIGTAGPYAQFMLTGLGILKVDIAFTMIISSVAIRTGVTALRTRIMMKAS